MIEFCTPSLQDRLRINRLQHSQRLDASELVKRQQLSGGEGVGESKDGAMEVVGASDSATSTATEGSSAVFPPPIPELGTPIREHFGEGVPDDFTGCYELMGVVTHKGRSADSGHYIGWVRQSPGSDFWWKYDDDIVSEVGTAEILNLKGGGDW